MLELATSDPQIVVDHRRLDLNDYELSVENGIVNLRTGAFRHRTKDDLVTHEAGTHFDASATCPRFKAFLDRVTGGDATMQEYLQRWMGYVLTGATNEHVFAFFHGSGANGKSTFIDIARRLLGGYATSAQPDTFMARRTGGGPSSDIARLAGKRLVISNEIRDGAQFEENLLKQIVGGDEVVAREMYASEFVFRPKLKLFIAGNHLPVIRGDDDGIWRRVQFIPFVRTIPEAERDKHLIDKLVAELPGILNWAIQGCLTWQKVGLHPRPAYDPPLTTTDKRWTSLPGGWAMSVRFASGYEPLQGTFTAATASGASVTAWLQCQNPPSHESLKRGGSPAYGPERAISGTVSG